MKRTVFSVITAVLFVLMAAAVFMNLFHFTGTALNGDYGLLHVPGLAAHDAFFEGKGVTAIVMMVLLALSALGGLFAACLALVKKNDKALSGAAALGAIYLVLLLLTLVFMSAGGKDPAVSNKFALFGWIALGASALAAAIAYFGYGLLEEHQGSMPEFLRKFFVSLKRTPQIIPILLFVVAFLLYTLNLTYVSHTTSRINLTGMGLCGFITMLFSTLSFVAVLNAFPKRKKPNIWMILLLVVMIGAVIVCDIIYRNLITQALTRPDNPIAMEDYIVKAYNMLFYHVVLLGIALGLTLTVPLYAKLLNLINTSIKVEGNENMGAIELESEN